MTETAAGTVEKFWPRKKESDNGKDMPHKVVLKGEEEGFTTWNSVGDIEDVEEGDVVELEWFENDRGYKTIDDIKVVEAKEDAETRKNSGSEAGGDRSDSGKSQPLNPADKDTSILLQVAFKEAVESVRRTEENDGQVLEQGKHLEQVGELTNGYFNLLQAQIKDKTGGEEQ